MQMSGENISNTSSGFKLVISSNKKTNTENELSNFSDTNENSNTEFDECESNQSGSDFQEKSPTFVFTVYLNDNILSKLNIEEYNNENMYKTYENNNIMVSFNNIDGSTFISLKNNMCTLEVCSAGQPEGTFSNTTTFFLNNSENEQFVDELTKYQEYF